MFLLVKANQLAECKCRVIINRLFLWLVMTVVVGSCTLLEQGGIQPIGNKKSTPSRDSTPVMESKESKLCTALFYIVHA